MQPEDLVGQTLGHYKLKRRIGYGGMATVFLANDIHLGREVALKVFWPRPGETQDFLRRFTREARVLAQLDHPNILPVYDYGEQGELAFLVTPYMAGGSLKEVLQERKVIPPSEAVQLLSQVLPALQYAHDRNLIHRDIKPGNLLFKGDGSLVLADFGLVKVVEGESREGISLHTISESGQSITGTPEYMSPEQINGRAVAASDIYSLGIVLYEMVTGTRPFTGETLLSVLIKQTNGTARPPRELNPYISYQLESALQKAMEKEPSRRFASPADFQRALQQIGNPLSNPSIVSPGNPSSNPGIGAQTAFSEYGPASGSDLARAQPGGQSAQSSFPGIPAGQSTQTSNQGFQTAPISNSQFGSTNFWQAQPVTSFQQQGGGAPATPFPVSPAWVQSQTQTVAPPLTPTPPQQTRPKRSRAPLAVLAILLVLVAGIVAALFLTPVGANLFGPHLSSGPTPGGNAITVTPGGNTTPVRGSQPSTPGSTQGMASTTTNCPAGSARAAIIAPLVLGHDPTIVYIVDETDASGNATYGTVKLFDTVNGKKTELAKSSQTRVTEAQVSDDGQWVLFTATVAGQAELRMVRLDGQGLQTLVCAPSGMTISNAQLSIDQHYVIFDEFPQTGEPTVYLLNLQSGSLQVEVTPPASGIALVARTWLDYSRVLMVGIVPNSDAPPQNIYILNIGKGEHQTISHITRAFTSAQACWDFDSSYDSQSLFIAQCTPGEPNGSSTISRLPISGGSASPVLTSLDLALSTVRVVDKQSSRLLAISNNAIMGTVDNPAHNGLYLVSTDGSTAPLLLSTTPANENYALSPFSQYFWSNISRDGNLYALQSSKASGSGSEYILSYGSLSGGAPTAFTDFSQYLAVAGWTTT